MKHTQSGRSFLCSFFLSFYKFCHRVFRIKICIIRSVFLAGLLLFSISSQGGKTECRRSFVARGNLRPAKKAKSQSALEKHIGYVFKNKNLRERALQKTGFIKGVYYTHRHLEFLGDAVLGFFMADILLERNPQGYKRDVSHQLAFWVSNRNLANLARLLHLDHIVLSLRKKNKQRRSSGEYKQTKNQVDSPSVKLADFLEALLGAVYLDGGHEAAKQVVMRMMDLAEKQGMPVHKDYRKLLYHVVGEEFNTFPRYSTTKRTGALGDGEATWRSTVSVNSRISGEGTGGSMKQAAQSAAFSVLKHPDIISTRAYKRSLKPNIFKNSSLNPFPGLQKVSTLSSAEYEFYYDRLSFLGNMAFRLFVTDTFLRTLHFPGFVSENREKLKKSLQLSKLPEAQQLQIIKTLDRMTLNNINLSSVFDFVLGALYVSEGYGKAKSAVEDLILESIKNHPAGKDYQHLLKNVLHNAGRSQPVYKVTERAYRHPPPPRFIVEVFVSNKIVGTATASKKKQAFQMAARQALLNLGLIHSLAQEW